MAGIDWNAPLPRGGSARRQNAEDMFPEVFGQKEDVSDRAVPVVRAAPPADTPAEERVSAPPLRRSAPVDSGKGGGGADYMPGTKYTNMPSKDYWKLAASNVPKGMSNLASGVEYIAENPIEFAKTMGSMGYDLAKGAGSKAIDAAGEAIGYGPVLDQGTKSEREALANRVGNYFGGRYLSGQEEFWKALAEDPVSVGLDVATFAPVIGAGGRAAGLGKVATAAEKVAALGDPINLALQGAKLGTKAVTRPAAALLRYPEAVATGVPLNALKIAEQSGRSADKGVRGAFRTGMKGSGDPREIARSAVAAMEEKRRAMSDGYVSRRNELTTQELPMTDIRSAFNDAMLAANRYGTRAGTPVVEALNKMDAKIRLYEAHPDAGARSAVQLDLLKRDLNDIVRELNPSDRGAVASVPKSVRDTIATVDSKYADMMDYWQNSISVMRDLQSTLGTGDRVSETARLARLMSTMKNSDKLNLLKQLEDTPSGKYLKEMIAGAAFKDIMPPAMQGFGLGIMGPILAGGPHGMAAAAAASPRLAGLTQYGIGRTEGLVNAIPKIPAAATNVVSQIGQEREGRKSGGRVSKHEADADQLVRAAERAKKGWSAKTEPLLNQSDEAVAKALEVANRSI